MDILKAATDWAKAEIFSSQFFILFGVIFIVATVGFWQLGKTEVARAYVVPTLVAGMLLLVIGSGLLFSNKSRLSNFPNAYNNDSSAFVEGEIERAENTIKEYLTIVFAAIPVIIIIAALIFVFLDRPIWRAISSTTIAMMVVILLVDNNANARIEAYHEQLVSVEKDFNK